MPERKDNHVAACPPGCTHSRTHRIRFVAQLAVTEAAKESTIRVENRNNQQVVTSSLVGRALYYYVPNESMEGQMAGVVLRRRLRLTRGRGMRCRIPGW